MNLPLCQIREWLGLPRRGADREIRGYSIDSRTIQPGELFFAIRGPVHDGHAYVKDALERGAAAAVVEGSFTGGSEEGLLRVSDPAAALSTVAARARRGWGGTLIAITGSSGKTTTKDAVAALLGEFQPVAKSQGNLNNEYGLPLSLLRIPCEVRAAVVEIGINHVGEMRPLAQIAAPDVSVVTNVGAAHVGNFASVDEIASEKRGLVEALRPAGTAVLNADDRRVRDFNAAHPGASLTFGIERPADIRASGIEDLGAAGVRFDLNGQRVSSRLLGRHNVYNVLAAVAAIRTLGIEPERTLAAIARLRPSSMRGIVSETEGVTVIDDCYNANPAAMAAMLDVLRCTAAERRIAVLGEMRELGSESSAFHRLIGRAVLDSGVDHLIAVGGDAAEIAAAAGIDAEFCASPHEAGRALAALVKPGDAVLLKASRGVGLERARDELLDALRRPAWTERTVA